MKFLWVGILTALAIAGCGSHSSAPVEVNIDQDINPLNPDGSSLSYPRYLNYIHIRAVEDQVNIRDARVNRGNCKVGYWFRHNNPLRFGDEIKGQLQCDQNSVKEVTITTDKSTYTFNF